MSVLGINLGNSFASIAVITNEGSAECIANEDGERQIAVALSFHGEELYIGNQAIPHLVKNAANTIVGFRDLLGLKFSEIPRSTTSPLIPSAPVVEHPMLPDTPCYSVQVLVPSQAPLPTPVARSTPASSRPSTQNPTPLATPRSEPIAQTRLLTPHDATVLYLHSLMQSASHFLGATPAGVVLTAPRSFTHSQLAALEAAAKEAGLQNVHLLPEDAAAAALLPQNADRTTLLIDWGGTHLDVRVLRLRAGLAVPLGSGHATAPRIAEAFLRFFAAEFSKKTGEKLEVCPPPTAAAQRAQTKLALALPAVARALTAQRPAQLSVESLANGLDFSTPLRLVRATMLMQFAFDQISDVVKRALADAAQSVKVSGAEGGTSIRVDSILWAGGGGHWGAAGIAQLLLPELRGAQVEAIGSPEEVLARGCAVHARSMEGDVTDTVVRSAASQAARTDILALRRGVGLLVPTSNSTGEPNGHAMPTDNELGGVFIPILVADTPLPARRTVRFGVQRGAAFACEVWEADEILEEHGVKPNAGHDDKEEGDEEDEDAQDDEDDEEDKPLPLSTVKHAHLGTLLVPLSPSPPKSKQKTNKAMADVVSVSVHVDVGVTGNIAVAAREGIADWKDNDGWIQMNVVA